MTDERLIGVTVFPEYFQSEGTDAVLERLTKLAHVNAVTTSPYVVERCAQGQGEREPPDGAGAEMNRYLDRPLWGEREVWMQTAPSFTPNETHYEGLRYQPSEPTQLTAKQGHIVDDFLGAAQQRGLKVYLQVQAAIPPGYRVQFGGPQSEDLPCLPDGRPLARSVSKNGSLASPELRAYQRALIHDLLEHYPKVDGLRFDWPEYPPYNLDSMFVDFGAAAAAAAERLGFDFERMRRDAAMLYNRLHGGLTNADLDVWLEPDGGRYWLLRAFVDCPGALDLLRFKAALVEELLRDFRSAMDEAGGAEVAMLPNAFPPPWTLISGLDLSRVADVSAGFFVKLYTMHWPMMLQAYGEQLLKANPDLDETHLVRTLVRWLEIADDDGLSTLNEYTYPPPGVAHPVGDGAQARKIRSAQTVAGTTPVYAAAHGYGPLADFRRRFEVAYRASEHGVWVNRYAYLSDEKLQAMGEVVNS